MAQPVDYIAKTLSGAAEVFALDDTLWLKIYKLYDSIVKNKKLKMSDKAIDKYFEDLLGKSYNKYILRTMKENLKENKFFAKAKIEI